MSSPTVWAVLIGLDFYLDPSNRLRGAVNDIEDMELSLKGSYSQVNIIKLIAATTRHPNQLEPPGIDSSWPTWNNITRSLNNIAIQASPSDVVYIHYSGHGTLQPTAGHKYEENYGLDAALVLFEPQCKERFRYLRGIELTLLLDRLVQRGLNVTVVLDSCHSGSISRSDHSVRGLAWNEEVATKFPIQSPITGSSLPFNPSYLRDTALKSQWLLYPRGYNLIAACGPHEVAIEIKLGGGRYNGALSYHLLEALAYCSRMKIEPVTYEIINRRICAKMYGRFVNQHPVLIGNETQLFLGTKTAIKGSNTTCEVVKVLSHEKVSLNVGELQGASIGDEYDVHIRAHGAELVQRVVITDVGTVDSVAKWIPTIGSQDSGSSIESGCTSTLIKIATPKAYVKVPEQEESEWTDLLDNSQWLEIASSNKRTHKNVPFLSVALPGGHNYDFMDGDNNSYSNLPSIKRSEVGAKGKAITVLEHMAKFIFVQMFDNTKPNCFPESDFSIKAQEKNNNINQMQDGYIEVRDGNAVQVTFENLSTVVLYITVLNLTPLREIKKLYPREKEYQTVLPHEGKNVLPKGMNSVTSLPGNVRFSPKARIPEMIKECGGSHADDILKFFVSTRPITRTNSMTLPDLRTLVIGTDVDSKKLKAPQVQTDFDEDNAKFSSMRGDEPWACKSIVIRSVAN